MTINPESARHAASMNRSNGVKQSNSCTILHTGPHATRTLPHFQMSSNEAEESPPFPPFQMLSREASPQNFNNSVGAKLSGPFMTNKEMCKDICRARLCKWSFALSTATSSQDIRKFILTLCCHQKEKGKSGGEIQSRTLINRVSF